MTRLLSPSGAPPMKSLFLPVLLLSAAPLRPADVPFTDTHFTPKTYRSLAEWQSRRSDLRDQILFSAGLMPMREKTPLNPHITGRVEGPDYTVDNVALETMPGYWLGGNLYLPKGRKPPYPGILHPHGHWKNGRLEDTDNYSGPSLGVNLARRGFAVFAYDMVGYNDTRQTPHEFGSPAEQLWSFGPLALQLWNSIRVLDYLTMLPQVDRTKLGMTGASGGGTQTFLVTAIDERVRYAAPVNMVSFIMQGGCVCENQPGLRFDTNNVEFAAMAAPRPMLIVAATGDWTRNVPKEEFPAVQSIYKLYGHPKLVEEVQFEAPHNYNQASREAVYRFLSKQVFGKEGPAKETPSGIEDVAKLRVFPDGVLPEGAKTFEQVFEYWKQEARRQAAAINDTQELKSWLGRALAVKWPDKTEASADTLTRTAHEDAIPFRFVEGSGQPVLLLDPKGIEAADTYPRAGRPLLAITVSGGRPAEIKEDRRYRHYLTFNPSDDSRRVQDVLVALHWLSVKYPSAKIEISATGVARWWALFAAATSRVPVAFGVQESEFPDTDAALLENLFVPSLQRVGGVRTALRLVEP